MDRPTGQRSLTQLVVEAPHGVTKTLEAAMFVASRHDVDVSYLLRTTRVVVRTWHHPQSERRSHNTSLDRVILAVPSERGAAVTTGRVH